MFELIIYVMHGVGVYIAIRVVYMILRIHFHRNYDKEYFWDHTNGPENVHCRYRLIKPGEPTKVYLNGIKEKPDQYTSFKL